MSLFSPDQIVRPSPSSISLSLPIVEPVVVSMLPVMVALAPERKAFLPFSLNRARPAAIRISAEGLINLNMATVRRISASVSFLFDSKGVPGIGIRALMGMEEIPRVDSVTAISIRSSQVSPIPMIPPEHTVNPALRALCIFASFSSKVWVVQIDGKKRLEVSMLLW